ncbi:3-oxoacyl-[acyl-carrier-protein] synthase III C-terminal domain-containing protein [Dactylosporangium sp. NPDC000244]|uniref:3-oxoacyl-ACP synthase III family protein n=1 Tax=Dactylosporangium sp. NPDC000244 TaxID=3154365 RepID=UPI003327AEF2
MERRITALGGVAVHLPEDRLSSRDVERRVAALSDGFAPPVGLIRRLTGVEHRYLMPADWQASDLAVAAAQKVLADTGTGPADVDLLIFASASQDMVEPATAHIVAEKLGLGCPVFDVKNACNSVLNAMEVADAFIVSGRYRRVLIACGESPSRATRWRVPGIGAFRTAFAGYTLSDAGAALLLHAAPARLGGPGILGFGAAANSRVWDVGTLPAGGSAHPREEEYTYFRIDGGRLRDAFSALGPQVLHDTVDRLGLRWDDFAVVGVHQVSLTLLEAVRSGIGVAADRLVVTLPEHGNLASASLPLQLSLALRSGRAGPGDLVALVGLGGGISLGITVIRL